MKRIWTLAALAAAALAAACGTARGEVPQYYCYRQAQVLPWHNGFFDPAWGEPVALVVPPNAEFQSNYGWGVGGTRVSPIYHQFGRPYPGYGRGYNNFMPTPRWPADTQQFGVHYIRGPW